MSPNEALRRVRKVLGQDGDILMAAKGPRRFAAVSKTHDVCVRAPSLSELVDFLEKYGVPASPGMPRAAQAEEKVN